MKKTRFSYITATTLLGISVMASSCGSDNASKNTEVASEEQVILTTETSDIVFPSLLQIASIFKRSRLDYVDGLSNAPANISKYESQMTKSFNFGVYSADLSYCVLNNQNQNALNYLNNVKKLSDDLGLSSIFNSEDLFACFEKNLSNQDSLLYVISNLQERLDEHLRINEMDYMASVYFTGGWVEAMFIATKSMKVLNNNKTSGNLIEQMLILDVIIKALEAHPQKQDALLSEVLAGLKQLKGSSDQFTFIKSRNIDDIPIEEIVLTSKEIVDVTNQIAVLRSKIVNI